MDIQLAIQLDDPNGRAINWHRAQTTVSRRKLNFLQFDKFIFFLN